jgi:hypothetical protein
MTFRHIVRPATIGDGLVQLDADSLENFSAFFRAHSEHLDICRFVPASGAASRMFADLHKCLKGETNDAAHSLFEHRDKLPFSKLFSGFDIESAEDLARVVCLELRLDKRPKGMIPFHRYEQEKARTAFEEQLFEAADVATTSSIHFTVSPKFLAEAKSLVETAIKANPVLNGIRPEFSGQKPETDTICLGPDGEPVRHPDGSFLRRPGGHGALLSNLEQAGGDVVFVKNIDNIRPARFHSGSSLWKQAMAGLGLRIRELARHWISTGSPASFNELRRFFPSLKADDKAFFQRPLRICGMVRNQGEPGGGPFWVRDKEGYETLQIVESAEVDLSSTEAFCIMKQATHFNPVDLVCFPKDLEGRPFSFIDFADPDTVFISSKNMEGQDVRILEYPGLWNGSMARWLTVFVEVPSETFAPVKTVSDLLRPSHL